MSKKPSPNFDDTRQYKEGRYSKKEIKEYCLTCGEIHGSKCPEYYIIHREEPKPACDHIVGVQFGCEECWEKNELVVIGECGNIEDITDYRFEKFYFCPKKGCGKPIDWEAIEKQLTQKKDDQR